MLKLKTVLAPNGLAFHFKQTKMHTAVCFPPDHNLKVIDSRIVLTGMVIR